MLSIESTAAEFVSDMALSSLAWSHNVSCVLQVETQVYCNESTFHLNHFKIASSKNKLSYIEHTYGSILC